MKNFVKQYTKGVVGSSLGANILEKLGGSVASGGSQGLQQMSNFFPVMGSLAGAKQSLNFLKMLKGKKG